MRVKGPYRPSTHHGALFADHGSKCMMTCQAHSQKAIRGTRVSNRDETRGIRVIFFGLRLHIYTAKRNSSHKDVFTIGGYISRDLYPSPN